MSTRLPLALGLVVLVTAIASGPLVDGVDLTRAETHPGDGTADVSARSVPTEEFRLQRGAFGAGRFHLAAPPAVARVAEVEGRPVVQYSVDIPALSITATTRYELRPDDDVVSLRHPPVTVSPAAIERGSYDGTVAIWLRTGDRFDRVFEERITVGVDE